jgi:putative transposase
VWRSRTQLELAVVEYVAWFNTVRLHSSLDNIPPLEYEQTHKRAHAELLSLRQLAKSP